MKRVRLSLPLLFLIAFVTVSCAPPETVVVTEIVEVEGETVIEERVITATPAPMEEEEMEAPDTIRIGINGVLSGPVASIGQDYIEASKLAVSEINADGGVLGREIELFFADNQCDPSVGVNSASSLIDVNEVLAFIGSSCSSVTLAVMPVAERAGVVQLTAGSTNPKITEDAGVGGNIWQFRLNIDDSIMAEAFSGVIAEENETVVIVGSNDDYGRGAADAFQAHLTELGTTILSVEFYQRGQTDYRPLATTIKDLDPDGLILIADAPDAAPFAVQLWEAGVRDLNVYGRGTVVTPEFLELTGDPAIWNGAKEVNRWAPSGSQLEVDYMEMWGREPRVTGALPYYGVYVLAEALEICGEITGDLAADRACLRDALEQVDITFPELGHVVFDDHNQAHPDMFITQWQDGEIALLERRTTE
jgi:branched-chain amino acid transport system substrate-binding protein